MWKSIARLTGSSSHSGFRGWSGRHDVFVGTRLAANSQCTPKKTFYTYFLAPNPIFFMHMWNRFQFKLSYNVHIMWPCSTVISQQRRVAETFAHTHDGIMGTYFVGLSHISQVPCRQTVDMCTSTEGLRLGHAVGEIGSGQNHQQQFRDEISNPVSRTAVFQLIPVLLSPSALGVWMLVRPSALRPLLISASSCTGAPVLRQCVMLILVTSGCCSRDAALLPAVVCLHSCPATAAQ